MTENDDPKVAQYYALGPAQFGILKSLTLRQGFGQSGTMEQSLSIVLAKHYEDETERLYLDFFGVRRLELKQPDLSLISIPVLEFLSGRHLPMVGGHYLIRDPEQERVLLFECRDFEVAVG